MSVESVNRTPDSGLTHHPKGVMRRNRHLLLAAVAALAVAGCGNGKTVDSEQVEKGIKDDLSTSTADVKSAKCPDDVKSEDGAEFICEVDFTNGATGKVDVTQTGSKTFTYELQAGSVRLPGSVAEDQIEKSLVQQGAPNAIADCPDSIVVKSGATITCGVTGAKGAAAGQVTFTFSAADGTVDPGSVKTS